MSLPMSSSLCVLSALQVICLSVGTLPHVAAQGAGFSNSILSKWGRELSHQGNNAAFPAYVVVHGALIGMCECRHQFRSERWNCTGNLIVFGPKRGAGSIDQGSREAAFQRAMVSAGTVSRIVDACFSGELRDCDSIVAGGHENFLEFIVPYAMETSRRFVDRLDRRPSEQSLVDLHNNRVGRLVMVENVQRQCACDDALGPCPASACRLSLPTMRELGDALKEKYHQAVLVQALTAGFQTNPIGLMLRTLIDSVVPLDTQLVFLKPSPDYCDEDPLTGHPGTRGRRCEPGSPHADGCGRLCCGRGYDARPCSRTPGCSGGFDRCGEPCGACSDKQEFVCK